MSDQERISPYNTNTIPRRKSDENTEKYKN